VGVSGLPLFLRSGRCFFLSRLFRLVASLALPSSGGAAASLLFYISPLSVAPRCFWALLFLEWLRSGALSFSFAVLGRFWQSFISGWRRSGAPSALGGCVLALFLP
jgi:hypothetical protein